MEHTLEENVQQASARLESIRSQMSKVLVGQDDIVNHILVILLSGGHALIEGVPGLGKTLLVKALAKTISAKFSRIQFTPDLMPSDITGHAMYDMGKQRFEIRKGPIFTNLLLADEINRAPAKTQSALLEVMQERQVTIEGKSFPAGSPFMVLATQNPIEQDGTYPLPEAELDRFMMKLRMNYPSQQEEKMLANIFAAGKERDVFSTEKIEPVMTAEDLIGLQRLCREITIEQVVLDYAVELVRTTRKWPTIGNGAGPRATLALISTARALALMNGQTFVMPDNIKEVAAPVLRHRIIPTAEMAIEGTGTDQILADILSQVAAPKPQ